MRQGTGLHAAVLVGLLAALAAGPVAAQEPNDSVVRAEPLLFTERGDVVWSPVGGELVYTELTHVGSQSTDKSLVVVHLGTSTLERITGAGQGASPTWSPDGARLAYIEVDPMYGDPTSAQAPRGDLVISGLGGATPRRLTRDGGYFEPRWVSQNPDVLVVQRDVPDDSGAPITRRIYLITPDEPSNTRMSRVLAEWSLLPGISGPRTADLSPSGEHAFFTGRTTGRGRRCTAGIMDLRPGGQWCDGNPAIRYLDLPDDLLSFDEARWSPDGSRIVLSGDREGRGGRDVWLLDVATGKLECRLPADDKGWYDSAEWADGGRALVGLYVHSERQGIGGALAPIELRLVPLEGGGAPVALEPPWATEFPISRYWQVTPDATGTRFTVASGGEIRVFGIGSASVAARLASRNNMHTLGQALLSWTRRHLWTKGEREGNNIPAPTTDDVREAYAVDADSDDFWVDLLRSDLAAGALRMTREEFESLLAAPNDPQGFKRPSYYIPEEAYGLELRFGLEAPRTPILRERSGIHQGGYHVLYSNLECDWIEEPQQ